MLEKVQEIQPNFKTTPCIEKVVVISPGTLELDCTYRCKHVESTHVYIDLLIKF